MIVGVLFIIKRDGLLLFIMKIYIKILNLKIYTPPTHGLFPRIKKKSVIR